jgi:S1-C subfamily serine protease
MDPQPVISQFERCFVRIRAPGGAPVGAGFLASSLGDVLTCAHVVTSALGAADRAVDRPIEEVSLDFPFVDSVPLTGKVHHWVPQAGPASDPSGDVAVVRVAAGLPAGARPAPLTIERALFGHPCRAYGYPRRNDAGIFAYGELRDRLSNGWLQLEDTKTTGRAIEPGFSGGPVQDRMSGRVVGIVVATTGDADDKVGFVIPSDILARAWPQLAIESPPDKTSSAGPGVGSMLTLHKDGVGGEVLLDRAAAMVRFGRDPSSDVVLPQPASWEHGRILLSGGSFVYQHLGRHPVAIRHRTGQVKVLARGGRGEEVLRQSDRISLLPSCSIVARFRLPSETAYVPTLG